MAEVTLTVQIEEELRRRAEAATAQRGESLDEIVRSAIEDYVNDSKRPRL
jgi:predicted HicB family RNase H-like nuclease